MRLLLAGTFAALAAAGCGASADDAAPPPSGVEALYGPAASTGLVPFPSNRYTVADPSTPTGLRVAISADTTADSIVALSPSTVDELNLLDGFSTIGGAYASFGGEIEFESVKRPLDQYAGPDAPMALVDVDPASPDRGKPVDLLPLYYSTTADGDYYLTSDYTVLAQPARPLRPKTKYLFVVTDRTKDKSGSPVQASEATRALLDGSAAGAYEDDVRAALGELSEAGVGAEHVVAASVFTTETVHDGVLAMTKDRRASPPPPKVGGLVVNQGPDPDGRVRYVGSYSAPDFRKPKPDGKWDTLSGSPTVQSTASLEYFLAFSNKDHGGKRPVVIYQHGLGGDKDSTWGTAARLAALDVAVFGIDAPEHGSRQAGANGQADPIAAMMSFFGVDPAAKTFDIGRARDNFRQMASDQLELVRFIRSLADLDVLPYGAPDGVPDLDTDHILYIGHSFGSVMGPTAAAIAPEIEAACWNVGGDGLTTLLRDSGTFKILVNSLRPAGTPDSEVARFFAISQAIVDPGDPANFAHFVTQEALPGVPSWRPRSVLLQEVANDNVVPNSTSELLARALGLSLVRPAQSSVPGLAQVDAPYTAKAGEPTTAMFQFKTADGATAEHGTLIFTADANAQYVKFYETALAGSATVIDPFAGK